MKSHHYTNLRKIRTIEFLQLWLVSDYNPKPYDLVFLNDLADCNSMDSLLMKSRGACGSTFYNPHTSGRKSHRVEIFDKWASVSLSINLS